MGIYNRQDHYKYAIGARSGLIRRKYMRIAVRNGTSLHMFGLCTFSRQWIQRTLWYMTMITAIKWPTVSMNLAFIIVVAAFSIFPIFLMNFFCGEHEILIFQFLVVRCQTYLLATSFQKAHDIVDLLRSWRMFWNTIDSDHIGSSCWYLIYKDTSHMRDASILS